jgi:glycosyltransferase involved in cell wall biosynthesis
MPVYNMEDTVGEAIETVLSQTFTDFELIICDNASTDGTAEICRAAANKDDRVTYYRNSDNILGENFRLAFLLSKGKYFMWAAADDSRKPEMVAKCVDVLESDSKAVLAYTHTELINPTTNSRKLYYDSYRLDQESPEERYISLLSNLDLGNAIYGLYRRDLLFKIPPLAGSNHLLVFMDNIFLSNVVLNGKIIQVPEPLFIRRRGGKGKSWEELLSLREGMRPSDYLFNGVSLPTSESIQEHVRFITESGLSEDSKIRLIDATYAIYGNRFRQQLVFEINRAVSLVKEGKFMESWNGSPVPHYDKKVQERMERQYAEILFHRLARTSGFVRNHHGLHIAMAGCLEKMGRRKEALLQIALANEISGRQS